MNCKICKRELEYNKEKGWIHKETNSIYIMKCKDCGYEGGNSITCPGCGSKNYVDDHCVSPDWSVEPSGTIIPQKDWFAPIDKMEWRKKIQGGKK